MSAGKVKADKHAGDKSDFVAPKETRDNFEEKTKLDDDNRKRGVCTHSKKKSSTAVCSKQRDGDNENVSCAEKIVSCAEKIPPKKRTCVGVRFSRDVSRFSRQLILKLLKALYVPVT